MLNVTSTDTDTDTAPYSMTSSLHFKGTMLNLTSTFVTDGTLPAGSAWQMLPIPMTRGGPDLHDMGYQFPPPCYDPTTPKTLGQ